MYGELKEHPLKYSMYLYGRNDSSRDSCERMVDHILQYIRPVTLLFDENERVAMYERVRACMVV